MEKSCFVNLYNCQNTWFASCILWTTTLCTSIFYDKSIKNADSMKRFRDSFVHRFFRGTGPLPTIFILCAGSHFTFLIIALICQGFVLCFHFLTRYLIKRFEIKFRPSGHSRVAMNTIIYFAYFEELSQMHHITNSGNTIDNNDPTVSNTENLMGETRYIINLYNLTQLQLTLVYMHCAVLFCISFVSGLSFHPMSELFAGMLLAIPQMIFLYIALTMSVL